MKELTYFQAPLVLLKDINEDFSRGMQTFIAFSIVDFALKQQVDDVDIARQLAYNAVRGGGLKAPSERILQLMPELESDYEECIATVCARENGSHTPLYRDILNHLRADNELYQQAIQNCQLNKINGFFGVSGPGPDNRLAVYYQIKNQIAMHEATHGRDPRILLAADLAFDLEKENDPGMVCMYLSVRSLEGQRRYTATDRPTITGRMMGAKSKKVLEAYPEMTERYNTINRYRFEKLLSRLQERNLIKSVMRKQKWSRFYISTKLSPKELGQAVAEQKTMRDIKQRNQDALKAFEQVYNKASK